ncbi:MAG: LysM peptidoglycan-binding domain-containing protein [Thermoflexales bacterium]|nr:LysM peptidoglycan-binding domain-containing protein [Thermoflexales bacterium]MCS7324302.1 LysM peptidoglycan-binding domain-containing protein [Thermoflexales bacterium]MDW8053334.1 LysM peptidoglycan-binding domain-containing protein [Anaerolineae bacterium]MDW8291985.1 LysM peptidoglycan-binding domain-containing protein [Anaerolineae bacterium]
MNTPQSAQRVALGTGISLGIGIGLLIAGWAVVGLLALLAARGGLSIPLALGVSSPSPEVVARAVPAPEPTVPPITEAPTVVPEPRTPGEIQPLPLEATPEETPPQSVSAETPLPQEAASTPSPAAQPTPIVAEIPQAAPQAAPEIAPQPSRPDPIPASASTPSRRSARLSCNRRVTHVVRSGENLFRIALRYRTTVASLMRLNGIRDPHSLRVGQRLTVITCAGRSARSARTHVVQAGETLFRIAQRYGTTVEALRAANGLRSNLIVPGQVLRIP